MFLIDTLNELDLCSSYSEIQRYERYAAVRFSTDIPGLGPGEFLRYTTANVDHNLRTLDGYNTFHSMGILSVTSPTTEIAKSIPRVKVTAEDITDIGKINITFLKPTEGTLPSLRYNLPDLTAEDKLMPFKFVFYFLRDYF